MVMRTMEKEMIIMKKRMRQKRRKIFVKIIILGDPKRKRDWKVQMLSEQLKKL
jgi:hypothetical protein